MKTIYFKGRQTDDGRWIDGYLLTIHRSPRLQKRRQIRARVAAVTGLMAAAVVFQQAIKNPAEQALPAAQVETSAITVSASEVTPVAAPTMPVPEFKWTSLGEYEITAYCSCEKCCGRWATMRPKDADGNPIVYTASGAVAEAGITIAVDTDVIPFGTEVMIGGHEYIAQDSGSGIKGNEIDIYFDDHEKALEYGRRLDEVYIQTKNTQ